MKRAERILAGAGCVIVLFISWTVAINSKSTIEKQAELMSQAAELVNDGIYIRAVPLLEEAAGYNTKFTQEAESELKRVYLALIDQRGFRRKYTGLLDKQMSRSDALPDVFAEAARYYLDNSRVQEALKTLKTGIERTGSMTLVSLYEKNRYSYEMSRTVYDDLTAIVDSTIQVRTGELWGLAKSNGVLMIPCEYEAISTFSNDRAVVIKDAEVYAIDNNNNRIAVIRDGADAIGNLADNRIPLRVNGNWIRATGELEPGSTVFEQLGMYSGGYVASKENGKWGVVDLTAKWLIPAGYDEIIVDELGRCYARGAVFARMGSEVYLLSGGAPTGETYENARPFSSEGFAAVCREGKWGYIDEQGKVMIDFIFDDALSFGQHLAAVRQGEFWGYINGQGKIVIEPVFLEAKSFSNGSAPVLTQRGWQFITLLEYKERASI